MQTQDLKQVAASFVAARKSAQSLSEYPGTIPETLQAAYAIQDHAIGLFAAPIGGWKVGRIMPPLSENYGANRLSGPIFGESIANGNSNTGYVFDRGFGAAEAEFLLRIGTDVDPDKTEYSMAEVAALIDSVHIGIEVASSPLSLINDLGPAVTISDFGNNNGLLIGPEVLDWRDSGFADWDVVTVIDGTEIGRGKASAFPDGPIGSVKFRIENLAERSILLTVGTWVSTGAVTGVHKVAAGQHVVAHFGRDLKIECTVEAMSGQ